MSRSLTITAVEGLPEIQPGDDIIRQIAEALSGLAEPVRNGDIAVVAQKVVSKAHNCFRNLNDIEARAEALEIAAATDKDPRVVEVVLQESRSIVRQAAGVLIAQHKSGHIMANAGLDRSNVRGDEDHVLVLPDDPDGWCRDVAVAFEAYLGVRMGVVMADGCAAPGVLVRPVWPLARRASRRNSTASADHGIDGNWHCGRSCGRRIVADGAD